MLNFLCSICHASKTSDDRLRMNVEDSNPFVSRFSKETWDAFVETRRPTQQVCNIHDPSDAPCWEIDVKSCRLNGITEANVEDIPIYSPLDEIVKAKEGVLYDYMWVDKGTVKSPLKTYIYDGPRWYDKATVKYMLETQVISWRHIILGFEATAHRPALHLANILKKIQMIWYEVGKSMEAEIFLGVKAEKKDRSQLLSKTGLLCMLGLWGRTENYKYNMITTSNPDDILWDGKISMKPTPGSSTTDTGNYVFHDISFQQKILTLGSLLPLNLIGRNQERLQVARILRVMSSYDPRCIISIQVDAVYAQFPQRDAKKIEKKFKNFRYCELDGITSPLSKTWTNVKSIPNSSKEIVYKCNIAEVRQPGGKLEVAPHIDAPQMKNLEWTVFTEPLEGPDEFLDKILDHFKNTKKSATIVGPPGVGKTYVLRKIKECLEDG